MPGTDFDGGGRDDMVLRDESTGNSSWLRRAWRLGVGPQGRLVGFSILLAALLASPAGAAERRCGWLHNPTPANWSLVDRHGEWLIGQQGGYQSPGIDNMPDLSGREWVTTNGSYGYGCACMTATTDIARKRVTNLHSVAQRPLRQCRRDHRLPSPLVEPDDSGVR